MRAALTVLGGTDTQACATAATEAVSDLTDKIGAIGAGVLLVLLVWVMMPRKKGRK